MRFTGSAISLNVDDPDASAEFVKRHFGFEEAMSADGFVSLAYPAAGFNLIYLRIGLPSFKPPALAGHRADGILVVFVVEDVDAEYARLIDEGVEVTTRIETEGRALLPSHRPVRRRLPARDLDRFVVAVRSMSAPFSHPGGRRSESG